MEDFRSDELIAVPREQGFTETFPGLQIYVITTKFLDVKVCWKDKSTNWIPLAEIKESNPVEVAEDSISFKNDSKPVFN